MVKGAGEWEQAERIEQDGRRMFRALTADQEDNVHAFQDIEG